MDKIISHLENIADKWLNQLEEQPLKAGVKALILVIVIKALLGTVTDKG